MTDAPPSLAGFYDLEPEIEDYASALRTGLARPQKEIPCRFIYDEQGSALFDRICVLEEYYPTRTETALLVDNGAEIAALAGPGCHLIEFGSGSSLKIRTLLDALDRPTAYTPIDISREHLLQSAASLALDHPAVEVTAICADYTLALDLPPPKSNPKAQKLAFFPGSSIGNFTVDLAETFLKRIASMLSGGGDLLIGADLHKDKSILLPAYNDGQGVTAAFNLNLLARANRELGADFDLDGFTHDAIYDKNKKRIEMHLVSKRDQTVRAAGGKFHFGKGETILTEHSHKYTIDGFQALGRRAGFEPRKVWVDENNLFSIHYMTVR